MPTDGPARRSSRFPLRWAVVGIVMTAVLAAAGVAVFWLVFGYPGAGARDFFREFVAHVRKGTPGYVAAAPDAETRAAYEAIGRSNGIGLSSFGALVGKGTPGVDMLTYHCIDGALAIAGGERRHLEAVVTEHAVGGKTTFEVLQLSLARRCTCDTGRIATHCELR